MLPAKIGEDVFVLLDPAENNGIDHAPAKVTNFFSKPGEFRNGLTGQTVNVRVLGDGPETLWVTSIPLFEQRPTPEQIAELNTYNPHGYRGVAFRHTPLTAKAHA